MGLLKHHGLLGTVVFLAAICTVQAAFVEWEATVVYDDVGACQGASSGIPVQVSASPSSSCVASTACTGSSLFSATVCSVTDGTERSDLIETTLPYLFGSSAYIAVERYTVGQGCDVSALMEIDVYLADGQCHKTGSTASYAATRAADKSAVIKTYTDSDMCRTTGTTLTVTAAQAAGNSCVNDGSGILDMKVYESESTATTLYLSSLASYDTTVDNCRGVPTKLETSVVPMDSCTPSVSCSGSAAPYTGITCSSSLTFQTDVAIAFGSMPYVIVESYVAGRSCDGTKLSSVTVYSADGQCHRTGSSASFTATRAVDGSAVIYTYANADCSGVSTTLLDASAAQVQGQSCANDNKGVLDKKIYGAGVTSLILESTLSFDTITSCSASVVPSQGVMLVVSSTGCTETSRCAGNTAPFTRIACTKTTTYQADAATMFGSTPYVIVESYAAGRSCDGTKLASVTVYTADGACHKTGSSASYTAIRAADGSVMILTYPNSHCTGMPTVVLDASAAQVQGQSCLADSYGVLDEKIYGAGVTPLYLKSTVFFDTNVDFCMPPSVPTIVMAVIVSSTACAATTNCDGLVAPYTITMCSTTTTFQMDTAVFYGTKPYVILEEYTPERQCTGTHQTGMTAYLTDGKCHKTGPASSYTATRKIDDSTTIATYTKSTTCKGDSTILNLSSNQIADNSCVNDGTRDVKAFGSGAYLASTVTYDSKMGGCIAPAVPTQLFTTIVGEGACKASNSCLGSASPYNGTLCSSTSSYKKDVAAVFGTNPYVIVEKYAAGKSCDMADLSNISTYSADTKCHRTSSTASFRAIRKADGSAIVMTYAKSGSCRRGPTTFAVTTDQATGNSCAQGATGVVDTKLHGGGVTPLFLFVTAIYDNNTYNCMAPAVPVQWVATTVSVDSCVPSVGCQYSGASYTSGVCSSTRTYQNDVAAAIGSTPYVTVESYIAGEGCAQSSLASVATYLADNSCHSSNPTASFSAMTRTDRSARVDMYMTSSNCNSDKWTLVVTADQVDGNECISTGVSDVKVYIANW